MNGYFKSREAARAAIASAAGHHQPGLKKKLIAKARKEYPPQI